MNIAGHFYRSFLKYPQNCSVWINDDSYSYSDMHARVSRVAQTIEKFLPKDLGPDSHIAVYASKSLPGYVGVLASLYVGRPYVPLNPRFPDDRNAHIINLTHAACVIADERCSKSLGEILKTLPPKLVLLLEQTEAPAWTRDLPQHKFVMANELEPEAASLATFAKGPKTLSNLAYTLFTSGSTGIPKGIGITNANVESYLENVAKIYSIGPEDRHTQHFELTFDVSVHDLFATWKAGAALYVVPENSALLGARFVKENKITIWCSVPSTAAYLRQKNFLKPGCMPTLTKSIFAGEALSVGLSNDWHTAAPNSAIYNLYGPTEATITITGYEFKPGQTFSTDYVPIGFVNASHEFKIVDDEMMSVKAGESGELCVAGAQVAQGYLGDAAQTASKFVKLPGEAPEKTWYRTGDLVSWSNDAYGIEFRGRIDRQVKIRGFRVELSEIESALRKATSTEMAAVIGVTTEGTEGFSGTYGFVCGAKITEAEIIAACTKLVPTYMVPEKIIFLEALPLNTNGKTDYKQLQIYLPKA